MVHRRLLGENVLIRREKKQPGGEPTKIVANVITFEM